MTTWNPANKGAEIILSGGDLVAKKVAGGGWESVIATGPAKTSGKWYFRVKGEPQSGSYLPGAICVSTEPTNNFIGATDTTGWLGITFLTSTISSGIFNNGGSIGTFSFPGSSASGDFTVVAYDADNGALWFTGMNAAGVMDTDWNGSPGNSPATNTGGISVTPGMALLPAASLIDGDPTLGDSCTLDTTTVIADSTLSGFSAWDVSAVIHSGAGAAAGVGAALGQDTLTTWDPANKDASIALSGGNLVATLSGGGWKSAIATGPAKTSGKWYFRVKGTHTAGFITGAICPSSTPTNDFLGGPADSYIGYVNVPASGGSLNGPSGSLGGFNFTGSTADGDYIVIAYDADNGGIYFTGMLASGSLDTSWNGTTGNPSTGSHPISVTPGLALLPAVSLLSGGDIATLDTTTAIADSTLSGFSAWDVSAVIHSGAGAAVGQGQAVGHAPVAEQIHVGGAVTQILRRPAVTVLAYGEIALPSPQCEGEIEALAPPAAVDGRAAGRLPGLRVEARALLPGEARLPPIRFAALGAQVTPGRASLIMPGLGMAAEAVQDLADDELMVILLAA